MRNYSLVFLAIVASFAASNVYASAWTQIEGKGQLILSAVGFASKQYFDQRGKSQHQPIYYKGEQAQYIEYGLWDGLTIGGKASVGAASQVEYNTGWRYYNIGLIDPELFVRQRLWQQGNFSLSIEPMVKLPSYNVYRNPVHIGSSNTDVGATLAVGYGMPAFGEYHFAELSAQYRHRFGAPNDQVRLAATLGLGLSPEWTVMPQVFATYRTKKSSNRLAFTQSSSDDYNLLTAQLSAVYKFNEKTFFQTALFSNVYGRNAGSGTGVMFSVWRNF